MKNLSPAKVGEELEFNQEKYFGKAKDDVSVETIDHVCVPQGIHSQ